jgi:HEAT repeat protein
MKLIARIVAAVPILVAPVVVTLLGCSAGNTDQQKQESGSRESGAEGAKNRDDSPPQRKPPADLDDDAGSTHQGKTLRAWLAQLRKGDVKARVEAAEVLGGLFGKHGMHPTPSRVAQALGEALVKDKSPKVRKAVIVSLWRVGPASVPALVHAVQAGDVEVRTLAIPALTQSCGSYPQTQPAARKAIPALIGILKGEDEELRRDAASALGSLDQSGVSLSALLEASKADDEGGKAAREVLPRMRKAPRSTAPALLKCLKDPEPRVRLKAAEVLCELEENDKECLAALVELIKRRDSQVRLGAAQLLARYGRAAKEATPALVEVVRNDSYPTTRQAAIIALLAIGPEARKEAIPVLIEVVRNETWPDTRLAAINALGAIGPEAKAAVPVLKTAEVDFRKQADAARDTVPKAYGRGRAAFQQSVQLSEARVAAVQAALKKIEK